MLKLLNITLLLFCSSLFSQNISLTAPPERINPEGVTYGGIPKISADGSFIITGGNKHKGLFLLDGTGTFIKELNSDFSAGWSFKLNQNGNKIVTRTKNFDTGLSKIVEIDYINFTTNTLSESSDPGIPFYSKSGKSVIFSEGESVKQFPTLITDDFGAVLSGSSIKISGAFEIQNLNSISNYFENSNILFFEFNPSYTKIAVHAAGEGIRILDLSTGETYQLRNGEYPCWINDDYLTFMITETDGKVTINSDIIVASFDGSAYSNITKDFNIPVFYPWANSRGEIVFKDGYGNIYKTKIIIN